VNSHAQEFSASGLPETPQPLHRLLWQMKGIVVVSVAVLILWLVDIELNDSRYSEATGRTIVGLVGK
jgi:hypothetical protein